MRKKDAHTKVSQQNTAAQKPVSPSGAASYVKNARQARKQKKNTIIWKKCSSSEKRMKNSVRRISSKKKQRHSLQKKSIRGLSVYWKTSERFWAALAAAAGWIFALMLTITTENTERQITMPKNPRYRRRSERFTTSTMEWTDTEAWPFIWHAKASITVR